MKRYRRLEVGEHLMIGDCYTAKSNPQPPCRTCEIITVKDKHSHMFNLEVIEDSLCNYYRPYFTIKLIRKYRLVRPDEPIQMFDWFKLSMYHEDGLWPAPDKQYNQGWCQVTPYTNGYLADNDAEDRHGFIFARFVDCIPRTKS